MRSTPRLHRPTGTRLIGGGVAAGLVAASLLGGGVAVATAPAVVRPSTIGDGVLGSWSPLGSGTDLRVNTLLIKDDTLYVGGDFNSAGGVSGTSMIASWSLINDTWHALGTGVNSSVWSLAAADDTIYASGDFTSASGVSSTTRMAAWSELDDTWVAISSTNPNSTVDAITPIGDDTVAIGGSFTTPQSQFALVTLATGVWSAGPSSFNSRIEAFAVQGLATPSTEDDTVYAGGPFTAPQNFIAALSPDESAWSALGTGLNNEVRALALTGQGTAPIFDDTLYAAGYFTDAGGDTNGDHLAAWSSSGNSWHALGSGLNLETFAVGVDETRGLVYAGGNFTQAQGAATNSLSRVGVWDSGISAWIPLQFASSATSNGVNGTVETLAIDDSVLYVGGNFSNSGSGGGSSSISRVARWTWNPPEGSSSDDTAYPGDTITLTGQGLVGVTSVRIGDDTMASFTRDDSTSVEVTIPAGTFRDDTIYVDAVGGIGEFGTFTSWPTIPEPPLSPVAEAGDAEAAVQWATPTGDGGSSISSYTATAQPGGASCTTAGTGCTVSGLANGVAYTFRVRATNSQGASDPSAASNAVTPVAVPRPPRAPTAPRAVSAVAGDRSAAVTWDAPADQGSFPVSTYQVTSSPDGQTCLTSATSCTVGGLANGTAYTFTVRALNGGGWSAASEPSNAVTPRGPATKSIVITGSREGRTVKISGTTKGIDAGSDLVPWLRLGTGTDFTAGSRNATVQDGEFTWQRRASRDLSVYFTGSGSRSNTVTIRSR